MACRNLQKAEDAKRSISAEVSGADLEVIELDLSKLKSVRKFADTYQAKYDRLDILIENAGIMVPPFKKTEDGFESQMGVNYFGHFLLANLLFPLLEKTKKSRIVTLSSIAHKRARIDFDNLNAEKDYSKMSAYGQSKLACLMFAFELHRRLSKSGKNIKAIAAHPGVAKTNIVQHIPKILSIISAPIFSLFSHPTEQAALPILMAALSEEVESGSYIGPTGFNEMKGKPGIVQAQPQAHDEKVSRRLWEVSEELTGEKFNV
ncbi:UNVERIFIED_CONTAM: hypothetical protein GTU68_009186 [Idotea baltica]|nr:hypothetical protein [Idotea baltica]